MALFDIFLKCLGTFYKTESFLIGQKPCFTSNMLSWHWRHGYHQSSSGWKVPSHLQFVLPRGQTMSQCAACGIEVRLMCATVTDFREDHFYTSLVPIRVECCLWLLTCNPILISHSESSHYYNVQEKSNSLEAPWYFLHVRTIMIIEISNVKNILHVSLTALRKTHKEFYRYKMKPLFY
jgi:hypothetical protein